MKGNAVTMEIVDHHAATRDAPHLSQQAIDRLVAEVVQEESRVGKVEGVVPEREIEGVGPHQIELPGVANLLGADGADGRVNVQ